MRIGYPVRFLFMYQSLQSAFIPALEISWANFSPCSATRTPRSAFRTISLSHGKFSGKWESMNLYRLRWILLLRTWHYTPSLLLVERVELSWCTSCAVVTMQTPDNTLLCAFVAPISKKIIASEVVCANQSREFQFSNLDHKRRQKLTVILKTYPVPVQNF